MVYLMESHKEAERLLMKSDEQTTFDQLKLTGLKEGMTAVDAGGGAGFVTKIMSEIVGPKGKVIIVDGSEDRLQAARKYCTGKSNIEYVQSDLEKIQLKDESTDYIWCRFVFEYLKNPHKVFNEFIRLSKKGGKIVVGDLDNNCLSHYPLAPHLEEQLLLITKELERLKMWDPYMGRKLYSLYHNAELSDIRVHFLPHHLIYGEPNKRDIDNWAHKIDQIIALSEKGVLKFNFDLENFRNEFNAFFHHPARFSYSPLILVEGVKN